MGYSFAIVPEAEYSQRYGSIPSPEVVKPRETAVRYKIRDHEAAQEVLEQAKRK